MTTPANPPPYRIQIVIDTDLEYFREVLLGVRHYGFETDRLIFADRWLPHELEDVKKVAQRDRIDGIVASLHTALMEKHMLRSDLPLVNVSNSIRVPKTPVVSQNDTEVGKLAARHLIDCGCRSFGFYGAERASYSDQRWIGFKETLPTEATVSRELTSSATLSRAQFDTMKDWLEHLPRPAGVFAALDIYALALQRAARELNLKVPEDIAILGAGNDDFQVEFEQVPLSSIQLPARRIGYEAAALLDRMLTHNIRSTDSVQLPVSEIALRRSTDVQFVDDALVAKAVDLIRKQPQIRVAEVAQIMGVARTGLQRRFHKALGRGLLSEIQRVRLNRAQSLLIHSDMKLEAIAEQSGYASVQRFSHCFSAAFDMPPGAYRRHLGQSNQ